MILDISGMESLDRVSKKKEHLCISLKTKMN
jgi:hypothetical protein